MALRIESQPGEGYRDARPRLIVERPPLTPEAIAKLCVTVPRGSPRTALTMLFIIIPLTLLGFWLFPDGMGYTMVAGIVVTAVVLVFEVRSQPRRARARRVASAGYDKPLRLVIEGSDLVEGADELRCPGCASRRPSSIPTARPR